MILGKTLEQWIIEYPVIKKMISLDEVFWLNPDKIPAAEAIAQSSMTIEDVIDASERLQRFAPYIEAAFPETRENNGLIESPIKEIPNMQNLLNQNYGCNITGRMFLKCDSHLPVSGSVKARGGIYEVLKHAEDIALYERILAPDDDYSIFASEEFRRVFSSYSIAVGSTGNLGLSIGIMGAKLGFKVTVHMSADALKWKKDLLRKIGVQVWEYDQDYTRAVQEGRKQALNDPNCYFIDDENSRTLFLGYAVAALRLKNQLDQIGILVDDKHPLFIYLPCGVGGGPGGISFGIKLLFKDNSHCFLAEPTHSCCMMLGLATGCYDQISVQDFGIDNITAADGLAVGRASKLAAGIIKPFISGVYSISDQRLFSLLAQLADSENIYLEPSAAAGMIGPVNIFNSAEGNQYIQNEGIAHLMPNSTHLVWATGGSMVPESIMQDYYNKGKRLL
ncbi:MAG TPA: D-serine ammonia-lyase [Syntrophomonadaceae bacterium]|nr:D-serine ammonia-lyase [Syntrophomonadaceae bacterium]HPR94220.1 D-serine ammonia-lyase [Syntrophomonadaceae bacterium]